MEYFNHNQLVRIKLILEKNNIPVKVYDDDSYGEFDFLFFNLNTFYWNKSSGIGIKAKPI
jgi:hypothetical protein